MDILMLTDVYFPRVNGVSTSIRAFAEWLSRNGHAVTIVAPDYGPRSGQEKFDSANFRVLRLPSRKIFFDPEDRLIKRSALRFAKATLGLRRWDVIHIHTPFRAHQLGVQLARELGRPTVESYHTHFEEFAAHYLPWVPARLLRWLVRKFTRRLCGEVGHLIVPSAQMLPVLASYGVRTPHTLLPTGLELAEFAFGAGQRFRREHGIDPRRPVIATISRLSREKNIDFLLQVAALLVREFPDLLFLIAGEGPDAARLRRAGESLGLGPNLRFFGNLDRRRDLPDCYRAADVFVFASPTETQGLVLIEAMASGLPIVSTAVLGTATVLREAHGALVSQEDPQQFAELVAGLLRSPQRREAMGRQSAQDAQAWGLEQNMRPALELYRRLAAGLPPASEAEPLFESRAS